MYLSHSTWLESVVAAMQRSSYGDSEIKIKYVDSETAHDPAIIPCAYIPLEAEPLVHRLYTTAALRGH